MPTEPQLANPSQPLKPLGRPRPSRGHTGKSCGLTARQPVDTSLKCVFKSLSLTRVRHLGKMAASPLSRRKGTCETRVRLPHQLRGTDQVGICSKTPKPHSNQANLLVENGRWGQTPLICGCSGPGVCGGWRFQGPLSGIREVWVEEAGFSVSPNVSLLF